MDGVLIDSLGLDLEICEDLFSRHLGQKITLSKDFIRSIFALDPTSFIAALLDEIAKTYGIVQTPFRSAAILDDYLEARRTASFKLLPGVQQALTQATQQGLKQVVVSNNPTKDLNLILEKAGISAAFSHILGNDMNVDGKILKKKPAPDYYLHGCALSGVAPAHGVVFEDSTLGIQAGVSAGCHVIGLLTGAASVEAMKKSATPPNQIYSSLVEPLLFPSP